MRLIDADVIKEKSYYSEDGYLVVDVSDIDDAPTIDPVKHGKWSPHPTDADWDVCSVCGLGTHRRFRYNDAVYGVYDVEESFAYCPRCGAKMQNE